jgi:hypothetical protein
MLRNVALVRTDISEERITFIITDYCHPDDGAIHFSKMSVLTTATLRNIPEDGILHKNRSKNLKSYTNHVRSE